MKIEQQIQKAEKDFRELYMPETAFGNVPLIKLNYKIQELYAILGQTTECKDCKGNGETSHDCDCNFCSQRMEDCEDCSGEGRISP